MEVAFKKGTTLEYVHQDHLGSTSVITNSSGTAVDTVKYYPFGGTRSSTPPLDTDKLFTGQRLDSSGLYYYNARYYDATIGRFISADSIVQDYSDPQAFNRYSYVLNNPLKYTDPSGHFLDTLFDVGSALYDAYTIVRDPWNKTNWAALGADVGFALVPFVTGGGIAVRAASKIDDAYDAIKLADKGSDAARLANRADNTYAGVRETSQYLKSQGFTRVQRKRWIESFDVRTIKVRQAGSSEFGLRYYDNIKAFDRGHFLFKTFPASRGSLALTPKWNQMIYIKQWQIRPGSTIFEGAAARQGAYPGGQNQMWVDAKDLF